MTTTVIVPAFNVEKYLSRCLDSLVSQTATGLDVVVVDDGSTDGTGVLAASYTRRHPQIRVVHRSNGGLSAARNTGLDHATGSFVAFLDGDDWADPEMVARLTRHAEASSADVVVAGCHVDSHDESGNLVSTRAVTPPSMLLQAGTGLRDTDATPDLVNLLGYAWNKMYRRELVSESALRFEEGLSLVEDAVFNAQAMTSAARVEFVEEAFVHYVQRPRATLGTQRGADYLHLRARAIGSIERILEHWGLSAASIESRAAAMAMTATRAALSSAANGGQGLTAQVAALRSMCASRDAQALVIRASKSRAGGRLDRVLAQLVASGRYRTALAATRAGLRVTGARDRS